ncbi:type I restriction-modification enzyme R subunit C-terminal domain-containing protein [Methanospirillum stamsii]|nr:type I restriction-modification enzyme R subunit C-terminal domain-containing protein [Methanospirillum stamsii]
MIQLWKAGNGHVFSDEQALWLEIIRDHIGTSLSIEIDDLDNLQVFL